MDPSCHRGSCSRRRPAVPVESRCEVPREGHDDVVPRTTLGPLAAPPATPPRPGPADDPRRRAPGPRPGWRDPRLWVGVVLVTGSVVAGARLLAAADDMAPVWAASSRPAARPDADRRRPRGHPGALRGPRPTRTATSASTTSCRPTLTLTRRVGGRAAAAAGARIGGRRHRVAVDRGRARARPHRPGPRVAGRRVGRGRPDRHAASRRCGRRAGPRRRRGPRRAGGADAFASAASRQLVLAVPEADEEQLGEVLAAVGDDRVRVVGRG